MRDLRPGDEVWEGHPSGYLTIKSIDFNKDKIIYTDGSTGVITWVGKVKYNDIPLKIGERIHYKHTDSTLTIKEIKSDRVMYEETIGSKNRYGLIRSITEEMRVDLPYLLPRQYYGSRVCFCIN